MKEEIEHIEIQYLTIEDYKQLKETMVEAYKNIPNPFWTQKEIATLIRKFPEGQVVIKVNGQVAGSALSIIVHRKTFDKAHTYKEITGDYTFDTHTPNGSFLYGIDLFIKEEYRELRLGRRLYDYRKELCERMNLRGIAVGGRIPFYHKYADQISAKEYIKRVRRKEIHDPVLNFQLSNDFHPERVLRNYLEGDEASHENAVLLIWNNVYFEKPVKQQASTQKTNVRIGLVQWQMRLYNSFEDLMHQAEFFIDTLSGYRSDFALFPEFFNAPLMAKNNHLSPAESIRELATHTERIVQRFSELAISYNINVITGSMPEIRDGLLYNAGYLCRRDGSTERYEKIHVTPDESKVWGMQGGNEIKTFDTDCGKIGVLICYDSEFPELSRIMADDGMEILFVPFLTDTQNGYCRVRYCAQARAIENECYVAIAGSVGNLPRVHNMDIQYAQSGVFTPCDFSFPTNGIKSETTSNTEMILIADVDLTLLTELHLSGSVNNLLDRRKDLYELKKID